MKDLLKAVDFLLAEAAHKGDPHVKTTADAHRAAIKELCADSFQDLEKIEKDCATRVGMTEEQFKKFLVLASPLRSNELQVPPDVDKKLDEISRLVSPDPEPMIEALFGSSVIEPVVATSYEVIDEDNPLPHVEDPKPIFDVFCGRAGALKEARQKEIYHLALNEHCFCGPAPDEQK